MGLTVVPTFLLAVLVVLSYLSGGSVTSGALTCDSAVSSGRGASCGSVARGRGCSSDGQPGSDRYEAALKKCFGPDINRYLEPGGCERCQGAGGSAVPTGSVAYNLLPVNFHHFNISFELQPMSGVQRYDVQVSLLGLEYCACTSATSYNFTLEYNPNQSPQSPHTPQMITLRVEAIPGRSVGYATITLPQHCADEGIPYDSATCGLPRFQRPTSIVLERNETHTNISWNKASTYISPVNGQKVSIDLSTYYLTVRDSAHLKYQFEVTNATTVTLNTSEALDVILHAYHECSGLYERESNEAPVVQCSLPANCSSRGRRTVCGGSVNVTSLSPPLRTESFPVYTPRPTIVTTMPQGDHFVAIYIAAGVAGLILIIVAVLVPIFIIYRRCSIYKRLPTVDHSPSPPPSQHSALVMYSPSSPEQEKHVIQQSFVDARNQVGIEYFLPDTRLPQQSLVEWIMEHFENTHTVFCVCNREFKADWENSGPPSEDTVVAVQTLRLLFEGDLKSVEPKRYAVVLSKPTDEAFIPSLLKTLPRINLSDTPTLVQFAAHQEPPV